MSEEKEKAQIQNVLNRIAEELVAWVQYSQTGTVKIAIDFDEGKVEADQFEIQTERFVKAKKPYIKQENEG